MSRIPTTIIERASEISWLSLAAVQKKLREVPNFVRAVSNSLAKLETYLGLSGALGEVALTEPNRERIALAVTEASGSSYCLSIHSYLSRNLAKLNSAQIVESIAHVAFNIFANYLNEALKSGIRLPIVPVCTAARFTPPS